VGSKLSCFLSPNTDEKMNLETLLGVGLLQYLDPNVCGFSMWRLEPNRRSEAPLEDFIVPQLVKTLPHFIELDGLLPY
jgi:hypothetical protein